MTDPGYTPQTDNLEHVFDVFEKMRTLPETSPSMLSDIYFSDLPQASSRIFRFYRPLPLHYHNECDEHLYVLSGKGAFHLDGQAILARPGIFLRFPRKLVHGMSEIIEDPLIVLSVDVPRRRPDDIVFVDPQDGTAADFMERNSKK